MLRFPEVLGEAEPFVLVEQDRAGELLALFSKHEIQVINLPGPGTLRRLRFPHLTSHEVRNLMVFFAVSHT
ncbi:MAG: hypothetical protein ACTHN5_02520 [Phycisphaerae bacterium]